MDENHAFLRVLPKDRSPTESCLPVTATGRGVFEETRDLTGEFMTTDAERFSNPV